MYTRELEQTTTVSTFNTHLFKSIKTAVSDAMLWFALILFLLIKLNMLAFFVNDHFALGINEVLVSLLGFGNIFAIRFFQLYAKQSK